jgi:uncharacterized membrane protein
LAAYCSHCGTELTGRFCAKCGAPAPNAPQSDAPKYDAPQPDTPPSTFGPPPFSAPAGVGLDENLAAALCYLIPIVTGVLLLFMQPINRNRTVRFHAFQAIFFWLAVMVSDVVLDVIFGGILGGDGSYAIVRLIWTLFRLAVLALWLVLMYRAYNREQWVLPVVGEMAQKFV